MKYLALILFGCCCHLALAQNTTASLTEPQQNGPPEIPAPLFILSCEGRTVELDPDKHKVPEIESLDSRWVNSIQLISGDEGLSTYGHKGRNGVIIIEFKANYMLPAQSAKSEDGA